MSMTTNIDYNDIIKQHFEFDTIGNGMWSQHDFKENVSKMKSASEWKCEFCGSVHPRKETGCHKCGAPRSFIYD